MIREKKPDRRPASLTSPVSTLGRRSFWSGTPHGEDIPARSAAFFIDSATVIHRVSAALADGRLSELESELDYREARYG